MEREVDGERQSSDWTYVYRSWDSWQDPDEVARQKREATEKARKRADRAAFMYSRDRSVERRVFERPTHEKVAGIYRFRARGNLLFREGQFARAAIQYQAALTWYEYTFPSELGYRDVTSSGGKPPKATIAPQFRSVPMVLRSGLEDPTVITYRDVDRLRLLTLANLAVCYLRTGRYSDCAESCTIAIFEAYRDLLGRNPTREATIYTKEASYRLQLAIERVDAAFLSVMGGRGAGDEASSQRGAGAPSTSASGSESGSGSSRGVDAVAAVSPSVLALADRLRMASAGGAPAALGQATQSPGKYDGEKHSLEEGNPPGSTGASGGTPVPSLSAADPDRAAALDALVILLKALLRRAQARRRARVLDLAARDVAVGLLLCGGTAEVSEGAAHSGAEHAYVVLPELRPAFVAFSKERAWVRRAARAYREKRRRVGRRMGAGAMSGALSVAADPEVGETGGSVTSDARSVLSGDSALSFHPGSKSGAGAGEDADDRRTAASVRADTALERDLEDEDRSVFGGLRSVRGDGLSEGQGGGAAPDEDEAVSLVGSVDRDSESEPEQGPEPSFRLASLGASRRDRAHLTTQQLIEAAASGAGIGSKEK